MNSHPRLHCLILPLCSWIMENDRSADDVQQAILKPHFFTKPWFTTEFHAVTKQNIELMLTDTLNNCFTSSYPRCCDHFYAQKLCKPEPQDAPFFILR